jgi:hypothetical protein
LAALAVYVNAFALDVLKEGALLRCVDVPEAEIVLVDGGHFERPPLPTADETANLKLKLTEFRFKRCDLDHTAICRPLARGRSDSSPPP